MILKAKAALFKEYAQNAFARDVVATCDGIQYHLDLRDDIQREMYFNVYEPNDVKLALELIPAGGTCLDIGANNGAFALKFAKKVGPTGTVHAYEPDPAIFSRLLANCRLNAFDTVLHCHQKAVSNVEGAVPFNGSAPGHSGWGSLEQFGDIALQTEAVDATTLDAIAENEKLGRVDLLKIEVEAHEPEVLAGAATALAENVVRYILIEFNGIRLAERGKTLEDFLRPLTTAKYAPVKLRTKLMYQMLDRDVPPENVVTNFLFAPVSQQSASRQ